jgi:hypothetical protein
MSEDKLPLPWHHDGHANEWAVFADNDWPITGQIKDEATAQLIAASPTMLAALHSVLNWFTPPNDSGPFPLQVIADAIEKASRLNGGLASECAVCGAPIFSDDPVTGQPCLDCIIDRPDEAAASLSGSPAPKSTSQTPAKSLK